MVILHHVSKSHSNSSIRSLLKMRFVNIKLRRNLDQYFVASEHLRK